MSAPQYELRTLADLLEAAKATDDVDGLFADLRTWTDLTNVVGPAMPEGVEWKPVFIWKDDGARGWSGVRIEVRPAAGEPEEETP